MTDEVGVRPHCAGGKQVLLSAGLVKVASQVLVLECTIVQRTLGKEGRVCVCYTGELFRRGTNSPTVFCNYIPSHTCAV